MTASLTCLELYAAILGVVACRRVRHTVGSVVAHATAVPAGILVSLPDIPALLRNLVPHGASAPADPASDAASSTAPSGIAMGNASESTRTVWPQSWSAWDSQIDAAGMVRWLKVKYPVKTSTFVAADIGAPVDTVNKWLARENLPNGRMLVLMICVYGPEFLAALLSNPPDWLDLAANEADHARLEARLSALQAELAHRNGARRRRWRFPGRTAEGAT